MTPESLNDFEDRRRGAINIDTLESCLFKALEKFKEKQKEDELESLRLHQAECPAFQGHRMVKWFVSLPFIATAIVMIHNYFNKK